MPYEPLHHKYRPQTFRDLVGQETISLTLSNALKQEKIAPAYLFTGPRGTGKTSSARILAKSLNCLTSNQPTPDPCGECEACLAIANGSALDVMEIDAASNTGVDNIREIIERARFAPVQCRYKIYAIDECHMLSTAAFNALLKTLEEPPLRVIFILATTDPQRVLSTIISRCQRFDYRRIPLGEMISHLKYIADAENIAIADEAITLIAQIANGGLRDAESLLDQLSLLPEKISVAKVWDLVGAVPEQDLLELLRSIRNNLPVKILQQCRSLLDRGREPLVVLQNLASFYLNLLIAKTAPKHPDMVAVTETCWQELCSEATNWDVARILWGQQQLKEGETHLKNTTQPRLWLEVTLLELLANSNLPDVPNLPDTTIDQGNPLELHAAKAFVEQFGTVARTRCNGDLESVVNPPRSASAKPDNSASTAQIQLVNTTPSQAIITQAISIPEQAQNKVQAQSNHQTTVESVNHTPPEVPNHTLATVSQSSIPVVEPPPKIAAQNPNLVTNNLANEEIWNKVVSCLHPPITKALFKQQCHLVSFNGSSAIIGISSVKLQRLHQGKVANIEAAFAQVCQSKIKVQLEVANSRNSSAKNSATPIDNFSSLTPETTSDISHIPSSATEPKISQPATNYYPREQKTEQKTTFSTPSQVAEKTRSNSTVATPPPLPNNTQSNRRVSVLPSSPIESEKSESEKSPIVNLSYAVEQDVSQGCANDYLQQAIDNLTQSFEGELVELDNAQKEFWETDEISEPEEIRNPNPGRPKEEDYEDEW